MVKLATKMIPLKHDDDDSIILITSAVNSDSNVGSWPGYGQKSMNSDNKRQHIDMFMDNLLIFC